MPAMGLDRFSGPLDFDALIAADEPTRAVPDGPLPRSFRKAVCKHWLRGLCKHGEGCSFLHQYDPARMPVCHQFAQYGECNAKDCVFLHRAVDDRTDQCPFYARGFCRKGPACGRKHSLKEPCALYLQGFCPDGPACAYGHPKFELPDTDQDAGALLAPDRPASGMEHVTCYRCWRRGHLVPQCPNKRIPPPPQWLLDEAQPRDPGRTGARPGPGLGGMDASMAAAMMAQQMAAGYSPWAMGGMAGGHH